MQIGANEEEGNECDAIDIGEYFHSNDIKTMNCPIHHRENREFRLHAKSSLI
jgi:hypothetical protein